jgi:hypothetical protein
MALHFTKHYSLDEARALLPKVRVWLDRLLALRNSAAILDSRLAVLNYDTGGDTVCEWVRGLAEIKTLAREFQAREIQLKDLERGLVDFPAMREGREVFLCWEKDEPDIEHWHDLETGYASREPL